MILSPTNGETVELRENLPIGSIVCKVQISDKDSGDNSKVRKYDVFKSFVLNFLEQKCYEYQPF